MLWLNIQAAFPLDGSFKCISILTLIISTISFFSIVPLPSISYIAKAQFSFWEGFPPDVIFIANRNSLKSIFPLLSLSKERNTCSQNWSGFPAGKNVEYTSKNLAFDSNPSGQSLCKIQKLKYNQFLHDHAFLCKLDESVQFQSRGVWLGIFFIYMYYFYSNSCS